MKLNTRAQTAQSPNNNSPIVLVHGLFGSLDNLGVLARDLVTDHDILQVDMRNHGLSGRSDEMTYAAMAQDLRDTLDANDLQKVTLIGHSMGGKAVMALTALAPERINGLVVIDEAYINFARLKTFIQELTEYPNLVVMQTFSKAWGLAGLRLGMAFWSTAIIEVLDKVKPPYNINQATQELVLKALEEVGQVNDMIKLLVDMRGALADVFRSMPTVEQVYPSDANFLLVKIKDARKVYEFMLGKGIVLRDRSNVTLCEDCLRITIGTEQENTLLVDAMHDWYSIPE